MERLGELGCWSLMGSLVLERARSPLGRD
jgi:hypothetical protein